MILRKIDLINFRNIKKLQIEFNKNSNIFIGDNAQGKTNILESIYFLALTKSYRTTDSNLIMKDKEVTKVKGEVKDNNIIRIAASSDSCFGWADNNSVSKVAPNGNGLLFKVIVKDEKSFYLFEFGASPYNPLPCRHIHHINENKNGWLVGSGEIFPNGWLLFIKDLECDSFCLKKANDYFEIDLLNKSEKSVQRTMGAYFVDQKSYDFVFASDHSTLPWRRMSFKVSHDITKGSAGVYAGNISDIDDFSKYNCLLDTDEVCYFFRIVDGTMCYGGQLGELSLSKNGGLSWKTFHLQNPPVHFNGSFNGGFVVENTIVIVK